MNVEQNLVVTADDQDSKPSPSSYQLQLSKLPATLPPPQEAKIKEEESLAQDHNEIIKQQQLQIEELKKALQRSNEQLLTQHNTLKCVETPENQTKTEGPVATFIEEEKN